MTCTHRLEHLRESATAIRHNGLANSDRDHVGLGIHVAETRTSSEATQKVAVLFSSSEIVPEIIEWPSELCTSHKDWDNYYPNNKQ
jgi:hypothetical protein